MVEILNPETLAPPRGYSNGMVLGPGRILFVAGQIGWDREGKLVSSEMTAQFGQALTNVVDVVKAGGGGPTDIGRLTIYVTDKKRYIAEAKAIGAEYRAVMGKHFPAMALVQVADLLEEGALVEIEATAVLS
jgi:enamine deaminase RidA (YjgF/YER057c/UK114 family)